LLDVARQTYKEAMEDAYNHVSQLAGEVSNAVLRYFPAAADSYR
jgi:hypothetical protein